MHVHEVASLRTRREALGGPRGGGVPHGDVRQHERLASRRARQLGERLGGGGAPHARDVASSGRLGDGRRPQRRGARVQRGGRRQNAAIGAGGVVRTAARGSRRRALVHGCREIRKRRVAHRERARVSPRHLADALQRSGEHREGHGRGPARFVVRGVRHRPPRAVEPPRGVELLLQSLRVPCRHHHRGILGGRPRGRVAPGAGVHRAGWDRPVCAPRRTRARAGRAARVSADARHAAWPREGCESGKFPVPCNRVRRRVENRDFRVSQATGKRRFNYAVFVM